ncbi:MAG: hypothetical protein AAGJ40_12095 [Planctomycetota bacterium]
MMSKWMLPIDVMGFELRRSMTLGRLAIWGLLVAFPIAIMATTLTIAKAALRENYSPSEIVEPFGIMLYFLVPEVTCLLGLLLWATPAISTEIEGQTWIYIVMRSFGRPVVLIGKYLIAVAWTLSAALVAVGACCALLDVDDSFRLWWVLSSLAILSCITHAALFVLIGVVFYRRTMVAAALYTLVIEGVVSFIPALVNQFTINYRLRGLLANGMGWEEVRSEAEMVFGSEPTSTHLVILALITIGFLIAAILRVERTEYPTQQEA